MADKRVTESSTTSQASDISAENAENSSFLSGIRIFALFYSFVKYIGGGLGIWYLGQRKCSYVWLGLASCFYGLWAIRSDEIERWKRRRKKTPEELVEVKKSLADFSLSDLPTWVSNFYIGSEWMSIFSELASCHHILLFNTDAYLCVYKYT